MLEHLNNLEVYREKARQRHREDQNVLESTIFGVEMLAIIFR
jgi:hypothetical protein